MACLGSIGSYKCALVIASKYFALFLIRLNGTVKEDNRNACRLCLVYNSLRSVNRTGGNDIYDQKIGTGADRSIDLLILCSLVAVCIIILEINPSCLSGLVQGGTDA